MYQESSVFNHVLECTIVIFLYVFVIIDGLLF